MFGIEDPWIWSAYLLCIGSVLLCIIYALIMRNRGQEDVHKDDVPWMSEEREVEEKNY